MHWIEPILERFERPLVFYADSIVGSAGESPQDIVRDTFLRLLEHGPVAPSHLVTWLFAVCRNRALENNTDFGSNAVPRKRVPRKIHSQTRHFLKNLPENQCEVLRLRFQDDLTYKEISTITHLSVDQVSWLIHGAVEKLRHLV